MIAGIAEQRALALIGRAKWTNEEEVMQIFGALVAALTVCVVSIGAYVGILEYLSKRPSVSVKVADAAVVLPKPDIGKVPDQLYRIEQEHAGYTGLEIIRLLKFLEDRSDDEQSDIGGPLEEKIDDAIQSIKEQNKYNELVEVGDRLQSIKERVNQLGSRDLQKEIQQLHEEHVEVVGNHLGNLVELIGKRRNPNHEQVDALLTDATQAYSSSCANIEQVVSDLEDIKNDLNVPEDDKKERSRLQVEVIIENRSRIDNSIRRKAKIAIYHGELERPKLFQLDLIGGRKMPSNSVIDRVFQSRAVGKEDEKNERRHHHEHDGRRARVPVRDSDHGHAWRNLVQ